MKAKRRSLTAYMVEPFKQVRFGLHVVGVSLFFVGVLSWLIYRSFSEQYNQVVEFFAVADAPELVNNDIFMRNAAFIAATLAGFVATMMFVVIRRTHKMYGPIVSFTRFLTEIQNGNYSVRTHIRNKDDFQNLAAKLNDVAEALSKRHGKNVSLQEGDKTDLDALDERIKHLEDGLYKAS
jgi:signal transduction histidine kinase